MYRTALITMPFAAVEYPSLALGLFKQKLADVSGEEIAHLVAKRVIAARYQDIRLVARGAMGFVKDNGMCDPILNTTTEHIFIQSI